MAEVSGVGPGAAVYAPTGNTDTESTARINYRELIATAFGDDFFGTGTSGGKEELPPSDLPPGVLIDALDHATRTVLDLVEGLSSAGLAGGLDISGIAQALAKMNRLLKVAAVEERAAHTQEQVRDQLHAAMKNLQAAKERLEGAFKAMYIGVSGGLATVGAGGAGAFKGFKAVQLERGGLGLPPDAVGAAVQSAHASVLTSVGHAMPAHQSVGGLVTANAETAAANSTRDAGEAQAEATMDDSQAQRENEFLSALRDFLQAVTSFVREYRESNAEAVRKILN